MREEFIYCSNDFCPDILTVELAGISYCDGTYKITRRKSDIYVLEYIIKGSGIIIDNGKEYTASENQVYLLKKGLPHRYFSSDEDPWVKIWMNLKGSLMDNLLEIYPLNEIVYSADHEIPEYFNRFHEELKSGKSAEEIHKNCSLLLHRIIMNLYYRSVAAKHQDNNDAARIKQYLEQHVLDNVSLEELSGVFYKSKAQIIRHFKKAYGITPYAYLLDLKLRYAKKLLVHTNLQIKEIGERLNFADEHYFSNCFRKAENISPSRYRYIHQKGKQG